MMNLCAPTIIYLIFSITQVLIDTFKGLYNTAIVKIIVTIMITLLLNILCEKGLTVVSWIIVFIPFILMTVLVTMILYIFGLDASTGTINYKCDQIINNVKTDQNGNIIIYDPEYNSSIKPVFYQYPNIIVPNPSANDKDNTISYSSTKIFIPSNSSSPAYQS